MLAKIIQNFSCNPESQEMGILRDQYWICSTFTEGILFAGFSYSKAV